jgi:ribosomal protein S18 acetylase RimI-like enzyme
MIPRKINNGTPFTIRRARTSDLPSLIRIFKLIANERMYFVVERVHVDMKEEERDLRRKRGNKGLLAVAMNHRGRVVGFLNVERSTKPKSRHVANLDSIGVLPLYRRRGLGRELTRLAIEWARSSGVRKLCLGVFSSNVTALRLYRSMGFVSDGINRRHYKIGKRYVDNVNLAYWF